MAKKEKWVVVYKRVHKTPDGKYQSVYVNRYPGVGLEYKIGERTQAKVGSIFCLPDLNAVRNCPEGNTTLKVLARGETKGPDEGALKELASTLAQYRGYWHPKRKGTFTKSYSTVFYKEVIPVEEL